MSTLGDRTTRREPESVQGAVAEVREASSELAGPADLEPLVEHLGDARIVMLGEASHGTSEFYRWRARLTAELIREAGASFVAVEGDWPDCYDVNRYVKGLPESAGTARQALSTFDRWPTWLWANWEVESFVEWLAEHNANRPDEERVGFYGLDVYSLRESMAAVVDYLSDVDPAAADHVRDAYRCFEPYGEEGREYARAIRMVPEDCEDEVVEVLAELRERAPSYGQSAADDDDDSLAADDYFAADQNALVVRNAEEYYRAMAGGHEDSWNVRDRHMVETLERLLEHHGDDAIAVVWAHNTHVGDARATDMAQRGRINVGQLARERAGADEVGLVGFGTYEGRVMAADAWGEPVEELRVPAGREGSYEHVFHEAGALDRLLLTADLDDDAALADSRGHRAMGVVYHPEREAGNYVPTNLPERYDAFVHVDETRALYPLDVHPDREDVPELYPWGL